MYVKNFPDRSTKLYDTIKWPGSYSTKYMEMAKRWYLENKDRTDIKIKILLMIIDINNDDDLI